MICDCMVQEQGFGFLTSTLAASRESSPKVNEARKWKMNIVNGREPRTSRGVLPIREHQILFAATADVKLVLLGA